MSGCPSRKRLPRNCFGGVSLKTWVTGGIAGAASDERRETGMPFREGYRGVYDEVTLARLQDIYEYVWLALVDLGDPKITRDDLAGMIIGCYEKGMSAEAIKEFLSVDLTARRTP